MNTRAWMWATVAAVVAAVVVVKVRKRATVAAAVKANGAAAVLRAEPMAERLSIDVDAGEPVLKPE